MQDDPIISEHDSGNEYFLIGDHYEETEQDDKDSKPLAVSTRFMSSPDEQRTGPVRKKRLGIWLSYFVRKVFNLGKY